MLNGTVLSLQYNDNGCGFNTKVAILNGMGLSNITSRIDSLNGNITISSKDGHGMSAIAHIDTAINDSGLKKDRQKWRKR